jgi:TRAP-type C4-dicarboxylate transport system permease small subunit
MEIETDTETDTDTDADSEPGIQLFDRLTTLCYGAAAVGLFGILLLMGLRIASRNLGLGLTGLQLYAQALGVWTVFVVAGALGWEDRHIEVDYFTERLPEGVMPYYDIAVGLVNVACCGLIIAGGLLAMEQFWTGTSPSVNIPLPLYYIPLIIGMAMLAVVYLGQIVDRVRSLGRGS